MKREDWVHLGAPQHYIGAYHCRYHRATIVGNYLVSTVARYQPKEGEDYKQIGYGRWGETYVFRIIGRLGCGCPEFDPSELDSLSYSEEEMSNCSCMDSGHESMCEAWSRKK